MQHNRFNVGAGLLTLTRPAVGGIFFGSVSTLTVRVLSRIELLPEGYRRFPERGEDMDLDERKLRVMRAVVEAYVVNAQPVGSRTIARDFDLGVSPATIRNEMADLERMGLLEQPHTSAGRIPSDLGYRTYVDRIARIARPARKDLERVRGSLHHQVSEMDTILRASARILSEMTDCLALMAGPDSGEAVLNTIELVPLRSGRVTVLAITEDGFVQSRVTEVPDVPPEELERASRLLNAHFRGLTLSEVLEGATLNALRRELRYCARLADVVGGLLRRSAESGETDYLLDGAANIMKQPEFRDVARAQRVLAALAKRSLVRDLLSRFPGDDLGALIGSESDSEDMKECSLVSAVYYIGGRPAGRMSVVGPRRMDYGRVMGLLKTVTEAVGDVLGDRD